MIIVETPNNVILLPATVRFYEKELTVHLERERYEEAVKLLLFLRDCHGVAADKAEEWSALLNWLQTMFPETALLRPGEGRAAAGEPEDEEDEEDGDSGEEQYVRQYVSDKSGQNRAYGLQLIELLHAAASPERQLMALEQLAFAERSDLNELIIQWLATTETHPMVQFRALQTLKKRGCKGAVRFPKFGRTVQAEVEDTPVSFDDYPGPIRDIIARIEEISEVSQPDFSYFARQTWLEFLAYAYATPIYRDVAAADREGAVDAWAAALHRMLLELIFGAADVAELAELYGITSALEPEWEAAYKELKRFARLMLPVPPAAP
ncbi:hypothetical protein SD70_14450 [Gordoniibacillus kamchatkensis]|uniref:Uncharacterized protein n=2 Tax=Gordoniibacillus kamchatkensis TaxID=1590651 RepID=A0ABR5AGW2_9BACL|nr:hypothetical protein SD70_14450 [Paenibacillus sp. VKM B-2647]